MLYYECHVTIEPLFDEALEQASVIAKKHKFKVADLLMKKRKSDSEERSKYDTFMSSRSQDKNDIQSRMIDLIAELKANNIKLWRYKIEEVTIDSNIDDYFGLGVEK